jgi:hypothetical protein
VVKMKNRDNNVCVGVKVEVKKCRDLIYAVQCSSLDRTGLIKTDSAAKN